jgi:hypothetical protein
MKGEIFFRSVKINYFRASSIPRISIMQRSVLALKKPNYILEERAREIKVNSNQYFHLVERTGIEFMHIQNNFGKKTKKKNPIFI